MSTTLAGAEGSQKWRPERDEEEDLRQSSGGEIPSSGSGREPLLLSGSLLDIVP